MGWLDSLTQVQSTLLDARGCRIHIRWNEFDRHIRTDLDSASVRLADSEAWSQYERSLRQVQSTWYHLLMSGLIASLGTLVMVAAGLMLPDQPGQASVLGAFGVAVILVAWRHPRWCKRRVWVMRCRLFGSERCFGCGYNMIGSSPEPDGCVVCPECGAAWALQRAGDPAQQGPREVG